MKWHGKTGVLALDESQLRHIKDWMEGHPEALWRKALWAYEKKNYTEAVGPFCAVLKSSLTAYYAFSNFYIGSCYLALGDISHAIHYFKEAEKYHGTHGVFPLSNNQLQIVRMWTAYQNFNPYQPNQPIQNFYYINNNNSYTFYSQVVPNNPVVNNNNNQTIQEESQNFKPYDPWKGF